jgi:hypothetical protein
MTLSKMTFRVTTLSTKPNVTLSKMTFRVTTLSIKPNIWQSAK